jgi:hypothetical protein
VISPVSSSAAVVASQQETAVRVQPKAAAQEQESDSVSLSAKAKAAETGGDVDGH